MILDSLPPKKQKYVKERVAGKSKRQAALSAGFSNAMANAAVATIETEDVKAAFMQIMRLKCPAEKIAQVVADGLDATNGAIVDANGNVMQGDEVNFKARGFYAKLAAEFGGFFTEEVTHRHTHELTNAEKATAHESLEKIFAFDSQCETPLLAEVVGDKANA